MNAFLTVTCPVLVWPLWAFLLVLIPAAVITAVTFTRTGTRS